MYFIVWKVPSHILSHWHSVELIIAETEDWHVCMLARAETRSKTLSLVSFLYLKLPDIWYALKEICFNKCANFNFILLFASFLFNWECLAQSKYSLNVTYIITLSFRLRLLNKKRQFLKVGFYFADISLYCYYSSFKAYN